LLGYVAGMQEGGSRVDSFCWAFVTATTVGYADFRPTTNVVGARSKVEGLVKRATGSRFRFAIESQDSHDSDKEDFENLFPIRAGY